jgi:hypothetical protein
MRLGTDSVTAEREGTEVRKEQIEVDEGSDRVRERRPWLAIYRARPGPRRQPGGVFGQEE